MKRYQTEAGRVTLARRIAEESAVLLKNENQTLPLEQGTVAFFGRAYYKPNIGGNGSGISSKGKVIPTISDECEKLGITPVADLHNFYKEVLDKEKEVNPLKELIASGTELVASGIIYDIFGRYKEQPDELEISEELLKNAATQTDTAVFVLGRKTGGEECDRRVENDYELLESEKKLIDAVCASFPKVILVFNINGLVDMSWISNDESIQSVLYVGTPGEQGPTAIARLLCGEVTPSGKLTFTVADSYESYPTAETFSFNKDIPDSIKEYKDYGLDATANGSTGFEKSPVTLYNEGMYMGYRYFDSFGKDVVYPFGFGLSYADFSITDLRISKSGESFCVTAKMTNVSEKFSGKEVLQIYVSQPLGKLEQPYQVYLGSVKTKLLLPGESEEVKVELPFSSMTSYDEEFATWILEAGQYYIRAGVSSRNTFIVGNILIDETIIYEQVSNALSIQEVNHGKIEFLTTKGISPITYETEVEEKKNAPMITLSKEEIFLKSPKFKEKMQVVKPVESQLLDVKNDKVTMEQFLSQLSTKELAVLVNGYGSGLPFIGLGQKAPSTIKDEDGTDMATSTHESGNVGYVSPALIKYGIPSAFYKDGPARVGKVAWPTGMTLACSFNTDLFYEFGAACGHEADVLDVDSWLAPGLNLQRNPIGGRNFEYFSEDSVVSGICGMFICNGVSETTSVTACPKHYALNEQETYRRGSSRKSIDAVDSIVSERVAREIYLKPFEMVIKNCKVTTVMTSFNKINGTFAGESHDLCTKILRDEWGYKGVVVTDWGDMDVVVDGANAVAAGNDVVMPGGPPVIDQVLKGYEEGRVSREQLMEAASNLLYFVMHSPSFEKYIENTENK